MQSPKQVVAKDPSVVGAVIVALITAVLVAADPSGALSGRWGPVVIAFVALATLLGVVRPVAYAPGTVEDAIATTVADLEALNPGIQVVDAAIDHNPPHGHNVPGDEPLD